MSTISDHRLWPGKAQPHPDSAHRWHPTTFHCLDVAACAEALLDASPEWLARLARASGLPPVGLRTLFMQLIALHDIGKFSEKFCNDLGHPVPAGIDGNVPSSLRHWEISAELLARELDGHVIELTGLSNADTRHALYAAVAGHHGKPPQRSEMFRDTVGVPSCKTFIDDLGQLDGLAPGNGSIDLDARTASLLSWSLAGLTVAADWIGSNQEHFTYTKPDTPTEQYWTSARERARRAVTAVNMAGSARSGIRGIGGLFGIDAPRPMQQAVSEIGMPDGPTLFVLEDITGSGKTEAAIALVERMMAAGMGEGVYVALPTMATANAMYDRLGSTYRRLYSPDSLPSIALAHGKRLHDDGFRRALALGDTEQLRGNPTWKGDPDDRPVQASCGAWLADDRRKTFLAEVGVGTIDQAFLAVLPVKFSTLRLFGLSRRILVVDEAHACDGYMQKALERTLEMQAAMRGSAIVMTATLTRKSRQALVAAFRKGLDQRDRLALEDAYPSLTIATENADACMRVQIDTIDSLRRTVPIRRLATTAEVVKLLEERTRAGACAVWIRNTVDAAIEAVAELRTRGLDVELFHARYAMHDRLRIEKRVVKRFGKSGSETDRRGRVLVATQVVEQSLDLDFDVMVSDIAPIDALVQRLGRLWRHGADEAHRNRCGAEEILHVLSPDPDDPDPSVWFRGDMGGNAAIYGAPLLWRTAKALSEAMEGCGGIASPDNLRHLLERVSGEGMLPVPDALSSHETKLEGESAAERALARGNLVSVSGGYGEAKGLTDNERYPTRAAAPSVRLVLARRTEDGLRFWSPEDETGEASEVGISTYRHERMGAAADEESSQIATLTSGWPEWKRKACPVAVVEPDGRVGEYARYDTLRGLRFES